MQHLDLSDEEATALTKELADITGNDRYPFSARIQTLRAILATLKPEPVREPRATLIAASITSAGHFPPRGPRSMLDFRGEELAGLFIELDKPHPKGFVWIALNCFANPLVRITRLRPHHPEQPVAMIAGMDEVPDPVAIAVPATPLI